MVAFLFIAAAFAALVHADLNPSLDKNFGFRVCRNNKWEHAGRGENVSFQQLIDNAKANAVSGSGKHGEVTRIVAGVTALPRQKVGGAKGDLEYRPHYLVAQKLNNNEDPAVGRGRGFGQWMIPAANGITCDIGLNDLVVAKAQPLSLDSMQSFGGLHGFHEKLWDEYLRLYRNTHKAALAAPMCLELTNQFLYSKAQRQNDANKQRQKDWQFVQEWRDQVGAFYAPHRRPFLYVQHSLYSRSWSTQTASPLWSSQHSLYSVLTMAVVNMDDADGEQLQ